MPVPRQGDAMHLRGRLCLRRLAGEVDLSLLRRFSACPPAAHANIAAQRERSAKTGRGASWRRCLAEGMYSVLVPGQVTMDGAA